MVIAVHAHKLAYMAVPKGACTSVKFMLATVDPEFADDMPEVEKNPEHVHKLYQTRRFRGDHWAKYSDYWKFTVVRDPVKRLMSVYTDKVAKNNELLRSPKLKRNPEGLTTTPDPDFFFQHLKEYMQASHVIKHHALPARLFIGPTPLSYDRVYRVDEFGDLADEISRRTNCKINVPQLNKSKQTLNFFDLAPKTQDALTPYLVAEYEHLRGYFKSPF